MIMVKTFVKNVKCSVCCLENKIITTEQASVLDQIRQNDYLRTNYFTGGTALSEYYLRCRG